MEKRIELERRARKPNQITELNLDNCRSTSIVGLTDEYTALETLSLINVGLTTLKGFPKLPNLRKLELSDNRISNGLNYLHTSPKLQYLYLCGNKIKDLEALKPLEEFKHLTILDLFNNEATQIENYREKIFEMLPTLKFLDGFDCNDVEAPSEEANSEDEEEIESDLYFGSSGEENDDDEDDEDDEDNDISLSEVYNDDLTEEDSGDWEEENAAENIEDDDDEDSDEDEPKKSAVASTDKDADGDANAEETEARGKKRKHEG